MTKKRACACLALALTIALLPISAAWFGARAEQSEEPEASVEVTSPPSAEPSASSSASTSESPEPSSSESPAASASESPTASASESPTASASESPTASAGESPTAEPTGEATPTVEPTATVYPSLQLGDSGDDVTNLQNRLIALNYLDGTIEGMPSGVFDEDTQTAVLLFQHQNGLSETGIADDSMQQILYDDSTPAYSSGEGPNGPGGGGMPGGGSHGGGSGGTGAGGDQTAVETGIIPGVALTSSHASGNKDMTRYWAIDTTASDESEQTLTLGGETLDISLSEGTFTATVADGVLTLTADSDAIWAVNGYALKILSISGIAQVTFVMNDETATIPTEDYLSGTAYAALRAQGFVSKDFTIELTLSGGLVAAVDAAGETYPVDGSAMILNAQSE